MDQLSKQQACQVTYFISDGDYVKIGKTSEDLLLNRKMQLQTGNPKPLFIEIIISSDKEGFFHSYFSENRVHNEWFLLPKNYIQGIKNICKERGWLVEEFNDFSMVGKTISFHLLSSLLKENANGLD